MRATGYVRHRVSVTRISRNFPGHIVMTRRLVTMWSRCHPNGVTGRVRSRGRPPVRRTAPGEGLQRPRRRDPARAERGLGGAGVLYLTVTVAPAPSRAALAVPAASLATFPRPGFGALSTRSLASLR